MLDVVEALLALRSLDDALHRAAALAVPALDQLVDLAAQRDQRPRHPPGGQPHRVEHVGILRVRQQHVDMRGIRRHRHHVELAHELDAERHVLRRQLRHVPGAAHRQPQFAGAGLGVVALGDQAQAPEQEQQAAAVLLLQPAGADQVGLLQFPALQQQGGDALIGAGRCGL